MTTQEAQRLGIVQRNISATEIQQRLISSLISEGKKILAQGIAQRAADVDVIWLNGYGFPRYRGGPMYFADKVGFDGDQDT